MHESFQINKLLKYYSSIAVFLFFSLSLIAPSGYSLGAGLLFIIAIPFLFYKKTYQELDKNSLLILTALCVYGGVWIFEVTYFQLGSREYDRPSRFIIAAIVLLYLLKHPPKQSFLWAGIAVGAIGAGVFSLWDKIINDAVRTDGFTNAIQYGNIAMLLGLMCLAGLGWAWQRTRLRLFWIFFLCSGVFLGVIASLLSGSRGGWIGAPLVLLYIGLHYRHLIKTRMLLVLFFILGVALISSYSYKETGIQQRIKSAISDIKQYRNGYTLTSIGTRFELWRGSLMIFSDAPIFGAGEHEFQSKLQLLTNQGVIKPAIQSHAHNEIFDTLAKRGLLGLTALITLYLLPFIVFNRTNDHSNRKQIPLAVAGAVLIFCYIDFGLTQVFFGHNNGVMFFVFALVSIYSIVHKIDIEEQYVTKNDATSS